jgi:DNA polymerase-3 subunit gamma/tau
MESFIVSARKYRPATFNTVVGQAHITDTLKNAIKTEHLAHAFLFCGPRGVGKTTCARILAKTINCTNRTEAVEACDQCESCKSFNEGASHNVFELDAASNNSVDDIRALTDQVRYAPQVGKYKVYVIDEVHMLSTNAFNAFLKTLEEPPKHAIFILATTEKHKIIPTILSRCQIFDFNRIQIEDIATHLAFIAKSEHITAEPDALHIIAQKADGALRDACSIFDQIVSFAGNNITYKNVIDNLNILDYDYYFKLTDFILAEDIPAALLLFNDVLNNGFDGHNFIAGLGDHLRNLLVSKDEQTLILLEVGKSIREKYREQAAKCSLLMLIKGLAIINKTDIQYKSSKNQRLQVELALMQLCSISSGGADTEKKNDIIKVAPAKAAPATASAPAATQAKQVAGDNANNGSNTNSSAKENTEPAAAAPQSPAKKLPIKTSSPSISKHLNGQNAAEQKANEKEASQTDTTNYPKNPVTQNALEAKWTAFANDLKAKGKNSLSINLTSRKPVMMSDNTIEFSVNNKTLEEAVEEIKMNLLDFLRKELNNYALQLNLVMTESEEKATMYTATEKYKYLSEKNPAINKLRQTFDLDLDL